MFECRTCVLRAIRAVAGDALLSPASLTRPLALTPTPSLPTFRPRRSLATSTTHRNGNPATTDALSELKPVENAPSQSSNKGGSITIANEKALKLELVHLQDPLKLANHVQYVLRRDDPQKALNLCRLASKDMNAVVSWNHVIEWHISNGKVNEALKIFNEMKKRGQFPDSYTYSRIFAAFPQTTTAYGQEIKSEYVTKALTIYYSMSSPTSRVKPTIMHTNAVLRVCSLARDMDALWSVASKIPDNGPNSADRITYSILLTAILHHSSLKSTLKGLDESEGEVVGKEGLVEQSITERHQAINEAKTIWQEVIKKWRAGTIPIDEKLVVAMAKVLLMSKRIEDWDDVLNLVEQTTKVERLVPPLGSPDRRTEHVPSFEREQEKTPEEDNEDWVPTPTAEVFKPVTPSGRDTSLAWVQPGNSILNVINQACTNMRIPRIAEAYWDKLTKEFGIIPDLANFHAMLGLLSINRSSTRAVNLVKHMHENGIETNAHTYRLAVSACRRDRKNHHIVDNLTELVGVMEKQLPYPDIEVLEHFLSTALRTEDGPKIVKALDRMDSFVHVLRSRITYGAEEDRKLSPSQRVSYKEGAVGIFQSMIGIIDTLMQRGLVPRDDFKTWHARRSQLNSFVGRAINSVEHQRRNVDERRKVDRARRLDILRVSAGLDPNPADAKTSWKRRDIDTETDLKEQAKQMYRGRSDKLAPTVRHFQRKGREEYRSKSNGVSGDFAMDRVKGESPHRLHRWKLQNAAGAPMSEEAEEERSKHRILKEEAKTKAQQEDQGKRRGFPAFESADSPGDLAMR